MQEILEGRGLRTVAELFAYEVLDRLDVVIRRGLDFLYALRIIKRIIVNDVVKDVLHDRGQRCEFADAGLVCQGLQPADLDQDTEADQAVFAADIAKIIDLVSVATVGRGYGL